MDMDQSESRNKKNRERSSNRRFSHIVARIVSVLHRVMESRVVKWGTLIFGVASMILVFGVASKTMYGVENAGNLLAYWHIALAWVASIALTTTFVGSVLFLRYRGRFWNRLAHSAGEIGFLLATLTLVFGSAWGKIIWNSWWEWTDVRLVTFLIVWFIYAGYLAVYSVVDREGDERYAAVYGVIGFVTVPISYASTRLWTPTFHETTLGNSAVNANIDPLTLVVSLVAATFLYIYLLRLRIHLHELEDKILALQASRQ